MGAPRGARSAPRASLEPIEVNESAPPAPSGDDPPEARRPASQRRKRLRRRLGATLLPTLAPPLLRLLARTWRFRVEGAENLPASDGQGLLVAVWHGRMLLGMPTHPGRLYTVLVSPSADGSLAKLALERFGYSIIRGSSSRQGARALRAMLGALKAGRRVVVTPDGPRGPRHATNPGLAWMARATGFPIVPIGIVADRAWHLSSWDAFTVAKPFARVAIVYGAPIDVPREGGDAGLDEATARMRAALIGAEERGCELLGCAPDW